VRRRREVQLIIVGEKEQRESDKNTPVVSGRETTDGTARVISCS